VIFAVLLDDLGHFSIMSITSDNARLSDVILCDMPCGLTLYFWQNRASDLCSVSMDSLAPLRSNIATWSAVPPAGLDAASRPRNE
jgi:hypothetical protein